MLQILLSHSIGATVGAAVVALVWLFLWVFFPALSRDRSQIVLPLTMGAVVGFAFERLGSWLINQLLPNETKLLLTGLRRFVRNILSLDLIGEANVRAEGNELLSISGAAAPTVPVLKTQTTPLGNTNAKQRRRKRVQKKRPEPEDKEDEVPILLQAPQPLRIFTWKR